MFAWGRASLLVIVTLVLSPSIAGAQSRADAERLTHDIVALGARLSQADEATRQALTRQLADMARDRRAILAGLMDTDPGAVLGLTPTAGDRAALPASVQPLIEQETVVEGNLEVMYEDHPATSVLRMFLNTGTDRVKLNWAARLPTLPSGTRVRVRGVRMNGSMALSGATSVQPLALATSNTFGVQNTLVLLVNFQNNPGSFPYSVATAQNVVFGQTSAWDLENSFGQTSLTGDVYGWFTIAMDSTVCDYTTLASLARAAATNAGVNVSAYQRYVYAFPSNACGWWGLGSVGGSPSQAWINGSLALKVVAHEMGHNFGLYHSNAWECGAAVVSGACSSIEYGDPIDMMGQVGSGHFNAFQKERIGWLNYGALPPITNVTSSGTYTIDPYAAPGTNAKALKILKTASPQTWYYVEYRRATGADSFLSSNANVQNGVVVHTGSSSSGNTSYLLDNTPSTSSFSDSAITVGNSFTDPVAGVTITPLSVGSSGAVVSVTVGAVTCARQFPTVSLTPASGPSVAPGTPVVFNASVTNNDSPGCGTSAFSLQPTWPAGWTSALSAGSIAVSPASTVGVTLTITSALSATAGSYPVGVSATNGSATSYTASAASSYSVMPACSFVVSPTSQSLSSSASSATASVTTTSGCTWNASSNAGWLSITSGSAGTASGTVRYSALANSTGASRTGTLTVAGLTVTVTQAASAGGPSPITIFDDFNRADSTNLGNGWTEVAGDAAIVSNELRNIATPTYALVKLLKLSTVGPTQTVSVSFTAPDNNSGPQFGLILRYQDPQNYYWLYRATGGSSQLRISRIKNGIETVLATKAIANPAKNTPFKLTAKVTGTSLSLDVNGLAPVTATDLMFGNGSIGIAFGGKNTQYRVDEFNAVVQ